MTRNAVTWTRRRGDAATRRNDLSPCPPVSVSPRRSSGFTLIELVVVMVILVLLAGTVTYGVLRYVGSSKSKRAHLDISHLETALDLYKASNDEFPTTEQGLEALIIKPGSGSELPNWDGPYLKGKKRVPLDPWGHPYNYKSPGDHNEEGIDIWTLGKDNKEGGTGENADVDNWSEE